MYLRSLELTGFKSFAKKKALDFTAPITAIVGPNGSGKSNCAEAFSFVLGEQSMKSMRSKRGEDLIWNGSKLTPRQNRASVKLTLDNTKRLLNLDFDEVALERVVHRDGINEYLVNGSAVRLRDIVELLAGAHIGPAGHHIISQGEADRVLSANGKERRLMIEDALGLKIYQHKKEEARRKLEKTGENIKQVESLRREIAPHFKFLRKQVEKLERVKTFKDELDGFYRHYLKREDLYLRRERGHIDDEKRSPVLELAKVQKDLEAAKTAIGSGKGNDKKSLQILQLEEVMRETRERRDALLRDLGRVEGELVVEERRLSKLKGSRGESEGKFVSLRDVKIIALSVEEKAKEAEKFSDPVRLKGVLREVVELLKGFLARSFEIKDRAVLDEIGKELEGLKRRKKSIEEEINAAKGEEERVQKDYQSMKTEIEAERDTGREAEKEVFRLSALEQELCAKLSYLRSADDKLKLEEEDFKRELHEAAVLVGRAVLDFDGTALVDDDGKPLSDAATLAEERGRQLLRRRTIEKLKIRIEELGAGAGAEVEREFREVSERDSFLGREIDDLVSSASALEGLIADLEARIDVEFREGIRRINAEFERFFKILFGGGVALLEVVRERRRRAGEESLEELLEERATGSRPEDGEEETREGVEVSLSLPHKRIRGLEMLSGGERALTSIALIFAISQVNPPPFIILDETDAALDEANSRKYADMIEQLAKYSQLVLITHNRETMSRAGVIYGVTMGHDGVSKLLSVRFEEAVKVAK